MNAESTEAETGQAKPTGRGKRGKPPIDTAGEQYKRLEAAELNKALAAKTCGNCATLGCWAVYNRERGGGRVRYVKCKGCGHCDQVPVVVKPTTAAEGGA